MSASTSPFGKRISFGSIPAARDDGVDQIFLIFAIHDREPAGVTERAAVPAQHAIADGMKCAAPKSAGIDRQQIGDAIEHLARGFVREGEQQNVARVDPVLEQIGDAISERARFARARARDDEQRSGRRGHRRVVAAHSAPPRNRCGSMSTWAARCSVYSRDMERCGWERTAASVAQLSEQSPGSYWNAHDRPEPLTHRSRAWISMRAHPRRRIFR